MLFTFELAKISKDIVLHICYVSTLPVFLCHSLLSLADRKHKSQYRCLW